MAHHPFDLSNRTAVVIGATSGLGRAIALALADAGADVVPTGRRAELALAASKEIEARGRRSLATQADVTDARSIETLAATVFAAFGGVDILVNAAGITKRTPTAQVSDAEWQ